MYEMIPFTGQTKLLISGPFYKPPFRSRMSSAYIPCLPFICIFITKVNQDTIHYTEKKAEKKI